MRRLVVALATLALLAVFMPSTVLAAAPGNDNYASATTLSGDRGSITGTTADATMETGEPGYGYRDHSVWYQWSPDTDGIATFSMCGTSWDSVLTIYTVTTPPPYFVGGIAGYNDDCALWAGDIGSSASFVADASVTYTIQVVGYSASSSGPFTLKWSMKAPSDSGTLGVIIKNLTSDPTECLVTFKGSNLSPDNDYVLHNATGDESLNVDAPGGTRWTYTTEVERSLWNQTAASLSWIYEIHSSDGTTHVTPKITNRCTAP